MLTTQRLNLNTSILVEIISHQNFWNNNDNANLTSSKTGFTNLEFVKCQRRVHTVTSPTLLYTKKL